MTVKITKPALNLREEIAKAQSNNAEEARIGSLDVDNIVGNVAFDTDTLYVDAANNRLGVGTITPDQRLVVGNGVGSEAITVNAGVGWADLILKTGNNNGGSIVWNDGADAGEIFYYHGSGGDYMRFSTNATERARINAAGQVLIGKTTDDTSINGARLSTAGNTFTYADGTVAYFNRQSSDGTIVELRRSNAMVGRLNATSGNLELQSANSLNIITGNEDYVIGAGIFSPYVSSDASADLGRSNARFKDLYLSGGVQQSPTTVASLPAASSSTGYRYMVNDSTVAGSGNFGATVVGGGSNVVPVYSDGTNWKIG